MMINGVTWLIIIAVVFFGLYAIATIKGRQGSNRNSDNKKQNEHVNKVNRSLMKISKRLQKNLPKYDFILRQNHITIQQDNQKIAMITLDKSAAIGKRNLGAVTVLNYHKEPNYKEVLKQLTMMSQ